MNDDTTEEASDPNGADMSSGPSAPSVHQDPRRPRFSRPVRGAIIAVLVLGSLAGIFFAGRMAVTGVDNASNSVPESVDRLIPSSGDQVLRQSQVGIDVASGYDASLQINGVAVREGDEGLVRDTGTGLIQFSPGPGRVIESLNAGRNCVVAFVWDQAEGESSATPVSWCFQAS